MTDLAIADALGALRTRGQEAYLGEPVTVTQHSLQAAAAAEAEGSSPSLVVAALLHDLGWLLHSGPRPHEERGAEFLSFQGFGPDVTEPVRLHVQAKRYLCTIDPDYRYRLSPESRRTLAPRAGCSTRRPARRSPPTRTPPTPSRCAATTTGPRSRRGDPRPRALRPLARPPARELSAAGYCK